MSTEFLSEFSPLRGIGMAVAIVVILLAIRRLSKPTSSRFDSLVWLAIGLALFIASLAPGVVTFLLGPFSIAEGEGNPRLVGLLVAAVIFLLLHQFRIVGQLADRQRDLSGLIRELAIRRYLDELDQDEHPDVLVVVPAYNEQETLPAVLTALSDSVTVDGRTLTMRHVVVVDGATDNTETVAKRFGVPAVLPVNRGQTSALVTGYEIARRRGARIVATIDADGQMVPAEIADLIAPIVRDEADLVNGSRVLGSHQAESRIRSLGVTAFGLLLTVLVGRRITDTSVGMRAIRVSSLGSLQFREERFGAAELLIEAHRRGLRVRECPVTILARAGGETRKPPSLKYGFNFGWSMLRSWLR